jgi:hypothetical protein
MRTSPLRLFMRCRPHDIWAVDLTRCPATAPRRQRATRHDDAEPAPMCRHALKPHLLFNVARCACRHIGAPRYTTRSSPRCALAPGTASPGLSNARLTQSRPGAPPSPGSRVCAPGRASRPCSAPALGVLRKLRHRPDPARRIAASGQRPALEGPPAALTPTALGRYRLPLLAPPTVTRARASIARECVGQDRAARHCGHALRRLRAQPQSR